MVNFKQPIPRVSKLLKKVLAWHSLGFYAPVLLGVLIICLAISYPAPTKNTDNARKITVLTPKPKAETKKTAVSSTIPTSASTTPKTATTTTTPAVYVPKPAPIVTPAPTSSVSGLTPTSSSSGTSSGSGSTNGSGGTSGESSESLPPVSGGYQSTNWSGYFSAGGKYTSVSADWTVASPSGGSTTSADGTWVGIGGITSGDLIQVGTNNTVYSNGQVVTQAFYEMLPSSSVNIPSLTVSPGDSISASVSEGITNSWTITITDLTTNQNFSTTVSYDSTNSSAEWIEEDPSYFNGHLIPFDDFGQVDFTDAQTVVGGDIDNLTEVDAQPITLVTNSNQPEATPSDIATNGNGFNVYYDTP